jgi:hypothetical protein
VKCAVGTKKEGRNVVLVFVVPFALFFFILLHLCFRENEFVDGLTLPICKSQPTHLPVCS